MKSLILPVLVAALTSWARAADEPPLLRTEKLTLKSGKQFSGVSVTEKRPDGVSIMHADGTARIKFEDLPDDVATKLGGFDPAAAKTAREAADRKEAAALEEIEKGVAEHVGKEQAKKDQKAQMDAALPAVLKVTQVTPEGVLCNVAWYVEGKAGKADRDAFGREVITYFKTAQLSEFSEALHFVTGIKDAVDGQQFEGRLVGAGTHRYGFEGSEKTVKKWTFIPAVPDPAKPGAAKGGG